MSLSKTIIAMISFLILFASSGIESKADCPDWATDSQIYFFTVDNCEYAALICWRCPVNLWTLWISVQDINPVDSDCQNTLTLNEIRSAIYEQVNTYEWLSGLCADDIPPCPDQYDYKLIKYSCWQTYMKADETYYHYVCDFASYCQQDWTICWDNQEGPVKTLVQDWYHNGATPNCQANDPGYPTEPGETNACWELAPSFLLNKLR